MVNHKLCRRAFLRRATALGASIMAAACAPKVVEKVVKETVIVAGTPEVVEKIVEKQVTSAPAPAQTITLTYYNVAQGVETDLDTEFCKKYEEENPNIKVEVHLEPGGHQEYYIKMASMWLTHRGPDVMVNISPPGPLYWHAAKGWVRPLDDLIAADGMDVKSIYLPAFVDLLTYNGSQWALPKVACPSMDVYVYNKDLWQKEGLPEPTSDISWLDMTEALRKLTKDTNGDGKPEVFGVYNEVKDFHGLGVLLRAHDAEYFSEDGTKSVIDSPEAMQLWKWLYDCYQTWNISPTPAQVIKDSWNMFSTGNIVALQIGYWWQGLFRKVQEIGQFTPSAFMIPKSPKGKHGQWPVCDNLCISTTCQHPQEAWGLVKMIASHDIGLRNGQVGGCPGARVDVWESQELKNDPVNGPIHALFDELRQQNTPPRYPANLRFDELMRVILMGLDPLWAGTSTPEQLIPQLSKQVQEVLDKPMA